MYRTAIEKLYRWKESKRRKLVKKPEEEKVTDYRNSNICGNCHEYLEEGDKYCRYCGTKRGEGAFEPFENVMGCIYGPPPMERAHRCPACGHSWKTNRMIDNQRYCPVCGGMCPPEDSQSNF